MNDANRERAKTSDFATVTELAGEPISQVQLQRLVQRYVWAARQCHGCDVLDVACGSGIGMGLFANVAQRVIGTDIDEQILRRAVGHYGQRFGFCRCDAQSLPFADQSFDVITLFEAIYYLPHPHWFFAECRRLLRPGGKILLSTANKDLYDFNPSPFSIAYLNPPAMSALLTAEGFSAQFFGGSSIVSRNSLARPMRWIKFIAARLGFIPKSMRGKRLLRRLIFGKLHPMPAELTGFETIYEAPVPIPSDLPDSRHEILYCVAEAQVQLAAEARCAAAAI